MNRPILTTGAVLGVVATGLFFVLRPVAAQTPSGSVGRVDISTKSTGDLGFPTKVDVILTEGLRRANTSEAVRVISYRCEIAYAEGRSAGFRGAPIVELGSSAAVPFTGVTLYFAPPDDPAGLGPLRFTGSLAPVNGKTWGQVSSQEDVIVTLTAEQVSMPQGFSTPTPMRPVGEGD